MTGAADEQVPIALAARMIGVQGLGEEGDTGRASRKLRCPFGEIYHSDGGAEPSLRLYPETNHAHCFAGCGTWGPVALLVAAWDVSPRTAARELLGAAGLTYSSNWGRLTWEDATTVDLPIDRTQLAEALKTFCHRIDPDFRTRQYDPVVAGFLSRCLGLLPGVATDGAVQAWMTGCKEVMRRVLAERPVDSRQR